MEIWMAVVKGSKLFYVMNREIFLTKELCQKHIKSRELQHIYEPQRADFHLAYDSFDYLDYDDYDNQLPNLT